MLDDGDNACWGVSAWARVSDQTPYLTTMDSPSSRHSMVSAPHVPNANSNLGLRLYSASLFLSARARDRSDVSVLLFVVDLGFIIERLGRVVMADSELMEPNVVRPPVPGDPHGVAAGVRKKGVGALRLGHGKPPREPPRFSE